MDKEKIIKKFKLNKGTVVKLDQYLNLLKEHNSHTNIVGKSTLINPWRSHILDSLQISKLISHKNLSIVDIGTGAGLPGMILSIFGYTNITLVDSNNKKINFLENTKKDLSLNTNIISTRIENINNKQYDVITSRALAKLDKLFSYSQKFLKKNSILIFLKGKTVNEELANAKKNWIFSFKKYNSLSDERGSVLKINNIKTK